MSSHVSFHELHGVLTRILEQAKKPLCVKEIVKIIEKDNLYDYSNGLHTRCNPHKSSLIAHHMYSSEFTAEKKRNLKYYVLNSRKNLFGVTNYFTKHCEI